MTQPCSGVKRHGEASISCRVRPHRHRGERQSAEQCVICHVQCKQKEMDRCMRAHVLAYIFKIKLCKNKPKTYISQKPKIKKLTIKGGELELSSAHSL